MVTCIENRTTGLFNATGRKDSLTMRQMLNTCNNTSKTNAKLIWVDRDFLAKHKVEGWSDMPVWLPPVGEYEGFNRVSSAKAEAVGLTYRPLSDTVRDTLAWFDKQPEEKRSKLRAGIDAKREKEVLKAWHERAKKKG